jgi:hypothetical protein
MAPAPISQSGAATSRAASNAVRIHEQDQTISRIRVSRTLWVVRVITAQSLPIEGDRRPLPAAAAGS